MIAPFTSEEANTGPTPESLHKFNAVMNSCAAACAKTLVRQWWFGGKPIANWLGWQDDFKGGYIPQWNLIVPLGDHPAGSTLSSETIAKLLGEEGEP